MGLATAMTEENPQLLEDERMDFMTDWEEEETRLWERSTEEVREGKRASYQGWRTWAGASCEGGAGAGHAFTRQKEEWRPDHVVEPDGNVYATDAI